MQGSMEKSKYCMRYGSHTGRDITEQHQASPCSHHYPPPQDFKNTKEKKKKIVFAGKEEDKHPYHRKTHAFSWSNFSYSSIGERDLEAYGKKSTAQ